MDQRGLVDYQYWQTQDKKTLKRINRLIQDTQRSPFEGIGKARAIKRESGRILVQAY